MVKYAQFLKDIRLFFEHREVLEVVTPYLSSYAIPDVYIDSLQTTLNKNLGKREVNFFHTSPEIEMKKILLQGHKNIYQIAKVFRDNEQGKVNFNEFTMLEWYRCLSVSQLIEEVRAFVIDVLEIDNIPTKTYQTLFKQWANIDNIHHQTLEDLQLFAKKHHLNDAFDDLADIQMFLFVHFVEQHLDTVFVVDYPKEQAGLSVIDNDIALRFELYIKGIEVANGAQELFNQSLYQKIFLSEINKRKKQGKFVPKLDVLFLKLFPEDYSKILYQTSGVAIGLDRLFMLKFAHN